MKKMNYIVLFDQNKNNILFSKRMNNSFKGLLNLLNGKVDAGENSLAAAYRVLYEETGIGKAKVKLFHFMDMTYYAQDLIMEMYVGQLGESVKLIEEVNPFIWLPLTEDFNEETKFAGEQNIAHIVNVAIQYPLVKLQPNKITPEKVSVGIDGCKGGWIAATIKGGYLEMSKYATLEKITNKIPFDGCIIDMIIGLQGKESDIRPDSEARSEMKGRASTIFPAPCRPAVFGSTKEQRLEANVKVLGKKFTSQTDAIIPKIREVDEFLQQHPNYKNVIMESHPEVCFSRLNGEVLMTSKHTEEGIRDRARVLSNYLPEVSYEEIQEFAATMKCNTDDITDSICLAIVSNLECQGKTETIPAEPMRDDTGLFMQMVVPKRGI